MVRLEILINNNNKQMTDLIDNELSICFRILSHTYTSVTTCFSYSLHVLGQLLNINFLILRYTFMD